MKLFPIGFALYTVGTWTHILQLNQFAIELASYVQQCAFRQSLKRLVVSISMKRGKFCMMTFVTSFLSLGSLFRKSWRKMLNHLNACSYRYELANRTLYFLLVNLSALNLMNSFTWEKNACYFSQLPLKCFGRLTFRSLTITSATTCDSCDAASAWP